MMSENEQRYVDSLTREQENLIKEVEELDYKYKRIKSENEMLKDCIVRMCLGKYGVLNE